MTAEQDIEYGLRSVIRTQLQTTSYPLADHESEQITADRVRINGFWIPAEVPNDATGDSNRTVEFPEFDIVCAPLQVSAFENKTHDARVAITCHVHPDSDRSGQLIVALCSALQSGIASLNRKDSAFGSTNVMGWLVEATDAGYDERGAFFSISMVLKISK